jgi:hypothetical protein
MTLLSMLDSALLLVILVCAFEALRVANPWKDPVRSIAFALISVGSFGWIAWNLDGAAVRWWSLCLHGGFAIYAVLLFVLRNPEIARYVQSVRSHLQSHR